MLQRTHIFTARKRSFRRLCFYTCLSVHEGACGRYTQWAGTSPIWAGKRPPPMADGQQAGGTNLLECNLVKVNCCLKFHNAQLKLQSLILVDL